MSVPAAYLGVIIIWSTTPLAIQWSSDEVGFLFGLAARMVLGAVLCLVLMLVLRQPFHWNREARLTYLAAGLGIYAAMLCVYWAAQYIPSGLVAVVYGTLPLVTGVLAAVWLGEKLWQPAKLIGIVLSIVGLFVIFDPSMADENLMLFGIAGVLVSTILHSISMIWVKRIGANIPALVVTSGGLWVSVPLYLLTYLFVGEAWPTVIPEKTLASIIYLGVMGSVVGFILFYYALKRVSATAIALITLITPITALFLGYGLNDERLTMQVLFGSMLVLSGLLFHQFGSVILKLRTR